MGWAPPNRDCSNRDRPSPDRRRERTRYWAAGLPRRPPEGSEPLNPKRGPGRNPGGPRWRPILDRTIVIFPARQELFYPTAGSLPPPAPDAEEPLMLMPAA